MLSSWYPTSKLSPLRELSRELAESLLAESLFAESLLAGYLQDNLVLYQLEVDKDKLTAEAS